MSSSGINDSAPATAGSALVPCITSDADDVYAVAVNVFAHGCVDHHPNYADIGYALYFSEILPTPPFSLTKLVTWDLWCARAGAFLSLRMPLPGIKSRCSVVSMVMPTAGMHEIANPFRSAEDQ